jgi:hypothetical protein
MAAPGDSHNNGGKARSPSRQPLMPWLPVSRAPANDNDVELVWSVHAFFARHISWLVPTLALAALSLVLLFLT